MDEDTMHRSSLFPFPFPFPIQLLLLSLLSLLLSVSNANSSGMGLLLRSVVRTKKFISIYSLITAVTYVY